MHNSTINRRTIFNENSVRLCKMEILYGTHIDREIESLIERIHPPRVCIDNDSCSDCTVVKIDSANRHGILLEMVQVLAELDLVISKSYISSDGGWLMDAFHVTDQFGHKLTDKGLVHYIQQALCEATSSKGISSDIELRSCNELPGSKVLVSASNFAIELTTRDKPGLFVDISTALLGLGFNVSSATAWTHNERAACIIHVEDANNLGPIHDAESLAHLQDELQNVVKAQDGEEEKKRVRLRLRSFAAGRNHTERRLHQMMHADGDYERCGTCQGEKEKGREGIEVSVGRYAEKGYWVVNVRSRDRPKLLFDTVCVLTDMQYEVFHATVSSNTSMADQEYFVRRKGSLVLENESEREKLALCLIAAVERRVCHGLKVEIRTENRIGLLSKVTRVIRENGLSIAKVEIGVEGETAIGSFYLTNCSGEDVNPNIQELVRIQTGGSVIANYISPYRVPKPMLSCSRSSMHESKSSSQVRPKLSLGSMLWSQLECLTNNFRPLK
ncbi:ACT domain-containing protein ACR1-like isoform X1 [Vigna radiata var. radiata]|uniref:ACT domain-containing protein ACR n=2 Tax=Vigna radiata var. radiata TaxID=3916 RepID=A0A1S3UKD9_VIGRR|nr:ACT domain-containing protein ACR1-like isoform X1 [Vigna radiata var. radiata]